MSTRSTRVGRKQSPLSRSVVSDAQPNVTFPFDDDVLVHGPVAALGVGLTFLAQRPLRIDLERPELPEPLLGSSPHQDGAASMLTPSSVMVCLSPSRALAPFAIFGCDGHAEARC